MTVDEIYSSIIQHQIKGLMIHEELAQYYDFLGLKGYKRCHEYHFYEETKTMRGTVRYYINHHNKLPQSVAIENPAIIPQSWYRYTRMDVDSNTRRSAVKNGIQMWVDWEKETKSLYEKMYKELCELGEVASAIKVKCLIEDVDDELKYAERSMLCKKAIDFDLTVIVPEQHELHEYYRKLLDELSFEYDKS